MLDRVIAPRTQLLVAVWAVVALASVALVLYGFEPLVQQRAQSQLLREYRTKLAQAAAASKDPTAVAARPAAPTRGAAVALLEIGAVRLQQVVVEGVRPNDTKNGPGHVPGSAGPGQPGNAVIVGRRAAFGGPFASLGKLAIGDRIVVTTVQGQSVYRVVSNSREHWTGARRENAQGPSPDDRLTLITSSTRWIGNTTDARVVVGRMEHAAFPPSEQAARTGGETGAGAEGRGWLAAIAGAVALAVACGAAVWLYRNLSTRAAHLITAVPLVIVVVIATEAIGRVMPAWL